MLLGIWIFSLGVSPLAVVQETISTSSFSTSVARRVLSSSADRFAPPFLFHSRSILQSQGSGTIPRSWTRRWKRSQLRLSDHELPSLRKLWSTRAFCGKHTPRIVSLGVLSSFYLFWPAESLPVSRKGEIERKHTDASILIFLSLLSLSFAANIVYCVVHYRNHRTLSSDTLSSSLDPDQLAAEKVLQRRRVRFANLSKLGDSFWIFILLNIFSGAIWSPFLQLSSLVLLFSLLSLLPRPSTR